MKAIKKEYKYIEIFKLRYGLFDGFFSLVLVFLAILIIPIILSLPIFLPIKNTIQDFQITDPTFSSIIDREIRSADTNIVLINIEDISNIQLAFTIQTLNQFSPKAIGINTIIKNGENPLSDTILAETLHNTKNIILSTRIIKNTQTNYNNIRSSSPIFLKDKNQGFSNLLINQDKKHFTVRQFQTRYINNYDTLLPFAVKLAQIVDSTKVKELYQRNNETETINWSDFKLTYSFDAMDVVDNPEYYGELVKNKIVLLGAFDPRKDDITYILQKRYFTPLNKHYSGRAFPDMYELEIHANIISMILHNNYFYTVPIYLTNLVAVILCFLNMLIFFYIRKRAEDWYELFSVILFVIQSLLLLFLTIVFFVFFKTELNLNLALLACAISSPIYEVYIKTMKPFIIRIYHIYIIKE